MQSFKQSSCSVGLDVLAGSPNASNKVAGPSGSDKEFGRNGRHVQRPSVYVALFATVCVLGITFVDYDLYARFLKWMTLVLFAYVSVLFSVHIPWSEAAVGFFIPRVAWSHDFLTTLLAIFGTTISPYLFFWQASQEVEDVHANR